MVAKALSVKDIPRKAVILVSQRKGYRHTYQAVHYQPQLVLILLCRSIETTQER